MSERRGGQRKMTGKLIVTFDKSQEDIPTLVVAKEGWNILSPSMEVINMITGEKAENIWSELTRENK